MEQRFVHISDEDLLRAADRELSNREIARIQDHLAACWTCRTRHAELTSAIANFVHLRDESLSTVPSVDGPRALLKLRLYALGSGKGIASIPSWLPLVAAAGCIAFGLLLAVALPRGTSVTASPSRSWSVAQGLIPDSHLTPGTTVPVTREAVCNADSVESTRVVPPTVAKRVFSLYGISNPAPRSYEMDYLITPALGGGDNIRNIWPQPYGDTIWNAHVKDALEDHLHQLVCDGNIDLATAQRAIADNWIRAYQTYLHSQAPLPQHLTFLKDRPWE